MFEENEKKNNSNLELNKFDVNNKTEIKLKTNLTKEIIFSIPNEKKIFGNNIFNINPIKCGKLLCFFYLNEKPLITIGPTFYYNFLIIFGMNFINIINIFFINFHIHNFFFISRIFFILFSIYFSFNHNFY